MSGATDHEALKSFYEAEAAMETRRVPGGRRGELRGAFAAQLQAERRNSVVDFGACPAGDGGGFIDCGIRYVGLDLAHGNAALARSRGFTVVPGSVIEPPFRSGSFEAGWSMSTLMHLAGPDAAQAAHGMARVLQRGSPICVGVWGGTLGSIATDFAIEGQERPFHLRGLDENAGLFTEGLAMEGAEIWEIGPDGWEYQVFWLRS